MLIDVPCSELAQELGQSHVAVQGLQNTLQQVLDQREEARQSRQLLELYLQALEKEGGILSKQQGRHCADISVGTFPWERARCFPCAQEEWCHNCGCSKIAGCYLPAWLLWLVVGLAVYTHGMLMDPLSHICFAESRADLRDERDAVDTGVRESSSKVTPASQILLALKEKPAPELSLSSQDLEVGEHQGPWPLQGDTCIRVFSPLQTLNHSCQFACNYNLSFPYSSVGKESAYNAGDPGLIPGLGRSPGEGNGNPLQYPCLENPMDCSLSGFPVHGVARVGHNLATKPRHAKHLQMSHII